MYDNWNAPGRPAAWDVWRTRKATTIGRRICDALDYHAQRDYERCCIHLFPALDATARRRRNVGVGERIRKFIAENEAIICAIATPGSFLIRTRVFGHTLPEALYLFGRTSIAHEGQLDERLIINDTGALEIGEKWNLPATYLVALALIVIAAPENAAESGGEAEKSVRFGSDRTGFLRYHLSDLWGAEDTLVRDLSKIQPTFARAHQSARRGEQP